MLGKLLKYEIPALGRKLIPLYIGWMVTAILLGVSVSSIGNRSNFIAALSVMLYTAVATAVAVMAIVIIVQRYSNSLLGDGGYFSHTLPVTATQHIACKTISALFWLFISTLTLLLTVFIIAVLGAGLPEVFSAVGRAISETFRHFEAGDWLAVIEILLLLILNAAKNVLAIYAAITIGHQANQRTTLASIGAYIGVLALETTVARILGMVIPDIISKINDFEDRSLFLSMIVIAAALSALYFFVCKYLIEKRLNLA